MTSTPQPLPPKEVGEAVTFEGGASGVLVVATRVKPDVIRLTMPSDPTYSANLLEHGRNNYEMKVSPGVFGVGGIGLDWAFIVENF